MPSASGCGAPPRRRLVLSLAAVLLAPSFARAAASRSAVPGGVASVVLGAYERAPTARVDGRRVLVRREGGNWIALVGISPAAAPGSKLRVEVEQGAQFEIEGGAKKYAAQRLPVPKDQVDLPAGQLARYEREHAHLTEVLGTFTDAQPQTLRLRQPVPGRRSATFGLRRYFNGEARRPHGGMDIAAPAGTAVIAAAAGRVADTG